MVRCKGHSDVCTKCRRYEPTATTLLYHFVRRLINVADCKFFKVKQNVKM